MDLVTGSTGMVGAQVVLELVRANIPFRAIKRPGGDTSLVQKVLSYEGLDKEYANIQWAEAELDDLPALKSAMEGIDRVYHCAALVSFHPEDRQQLFDINFSGTRTIVDLCLEMDIKKLCYVSSTAAIGDQLTDGLKTEDGKWLTDEGKSPYSLSKRLAEIEVWRGIEEGLKAVIVNPGIIIGPGKKGQSSASLFNSVQNGLKFYTSGINGFVYAGDVARAMVMLMQGNYSERRYIMVAENVHYKTLFEYIADALELNGPSIGVPKLLSEMAWRFLKTWNKVSGNKPAITKETVRSAYKINRFSSSKIKSELNFSFTSVKDAVQKSAPFYLGP